MAAVTNMANEGENTLCPKHRKNFGAVNPVVG
jgi:hypothetical protein